MSAAADPGSHAGGPAEIVVRGAREHNLRGIDVRIPRGQLVVITGLSGSGKSSLAFDTLYAEGQRRYVESLSAYARQFLEQLGKPDVDSIEGLSPAISIEQKSTARNPRSTVATVTEIYDYLRLLYARVGTPHCARCDRPIQRQTIPQMIAQLRQLPDGTRVEILSPVVRDRKGEHREELVRFAREGFLRARIDGERVDLDAPPKLKRSVRHTIELVVDRIALRLSGDAAGEGRLAESLETALRASGGYAHVDVGPGEQRLRFSELAACLDCGASYPEIEPRLFSFNSPHGACPRCGGMGTHDYFDPDRVVPDPALSVAEGAIAPMRGRGLTSRYYAALLRALGEQIGFDLNTPWEKLPARLRTELLHGGGEPRAVRWRRGRRSFNSSWLGVLDYLDRRYKDAESDAVREDLLRYMGAAPCPECEGARLRPEARAVRLAGRGIHELCALPIDEAEAALAELELDPQAGAIAERPLQEIRSRLRFLQSVGLAYLTLDRRASTLSGGEAQRIRLATQVGAALVGVLYILDEPSIGLHARDNERLLGTLRALQRSGNSVIVVEHDEATIRASDHVIDLGPGAGRHGGEIVAQGSPAALEKDARSLTGAYLSGRRAIAVPRRRRADSDRAITVEGATEHNLRGIRARFPLGTFTVVTGVSGSGKSTLVNDILQRALAQHLYGARERPGRHEKITGLEHVDKVIDVNQQPIGRTSRSNPATYTGLFGPIRELYAQLPESRTRGYAAGRFSFNVKGGRCEACQGDGILRIEMHFLPDVFVTCEECGGRRYNPQTLEVRYKGHSIAELLDMTIDEALELLESFPGPRRTLETLVEVGLGYLHLGQSATTLSGGEAQRIKLARELSRRSTGRTLYILDEPTTGLHFADVDRLLQVLQRLVDRGNSVIAIEHNLDVIKTADHLIDLGPEGGAGGGEIVAQGTPEEVAASERSFTGAALRPLLGRSPRRATRS